MSPRSVGVEEELLLVEPETGQPRAVAEIVLAAVRQAAAPAGADGRDGDGAALELELKQQQLETNSEPCRTLGELHGEIRRGRAAAATAAERAGVRVAALATPPVPVEPEVVGTSRYRRMADVFGLTAQEQLTCGCHVHVGISCDEEGVAVLDRIGPWLSVLLALSANSPFWQGQDSSYASFRYQAWGRWPVSGPTGPFGTARSYHETVRQMVQTGTLLDDGMVYFDARLSGHYQTIEIRVADVCLRPDDTVLIAALARAGQRRGLPAGRVPPVRKPARGDPPRGHRHRKRSAQLRLTADPAGWLTSPDTSSARRVRALRIAWASPSLLK